MQSGQSHEGFITVIPAWTPESSAMDGSQTMAQAPVLSAVPAQRLPSLDARIPASLPE
jgi:hypothetical protein